MSFLKRLDEQLISNRSNLFGHDEIFNNCKKIIDLVHNQDNELKLLFEELDIRSINIFHGETGTGKTTLSYELAKYVLEKYEVETYELKAQEIITDNLGKTLGNFHKAYEEINDLCSKDKGIVLLLMSLTDF
ncbi:AAA family ATPase [Halarcobacter sp.]|uniref:AAA family ATPase n=1 Tax=Halarcobacter sp. TaxID=2321133 RepID=UPI0029F54A34|nr:AAA family ATPase [Halarcobacter sp.]